MVRVVIVDDSASVRLFLRQLLTADPEIKVVGTAADGEEALEVVVRLTPDVVTMDIHMPRMNGLIATRRLMETHPLPIVIVSSVLDAEEVASTFHALEAGAVAAVPLPRGTGRPDAGEEARSFVQTVKLMAAVKVVRRWRLPAVAAPSPTFLRSRCLGPAVQVQVVAIGASTGGPPVVQKILEGVPPAFPAAILIVQHMATGFTAGFAKWLNQTSGLPVRLATHDEQLLPGHAYLAPDGCHMEVAAAGNRIVLVNTPPENGLRPSVSVLFRSVAHGYGGKAIGVLLTGMGSDGAEGLLLMKEKGAITIVQDRESSVIHGMPGEALKLDAATCTLPPEGIIAALKSLVMEN